MDLEINAPARISLGGGGTDLASYYERWGGYFLSAAIKLPVRIRLGRSSAGWVPLVKDSLGQWFEAQGVEAPRAVWLRTSVPSGAGLGFSGALSVALVRLVEELRGVAMPLRDRAVAAYALERAIFSRHAGRQDTIVAVYGGLKEYRLEAGGAAVGEVPMSPVHRSALMSRLLLVDTAARRSADSVLADQDIKLAADSEAMKKNLDRIKQIAFEVRELLCRGDLDGFGNAMHQHWMYKRERSAGITSSSIDELYAWGLANGAIGGKLIGAGAGGFLLMFAKDPDRLRTSYQQRGVQVRSVELEDAGAHLC
ncbi:GHMP family kinase ATP-binding protein [Kribbella monticola]|uniref:GHMP family kinase ATP-binding protein n=1 Tax=Kribbella monticola TaxID=2185285 RepID=UPI000DD35F2B|nr:hypothetical protein [Kribbella monticola]